MKELTNVKRKDLIITDQWTETGGARLYMTCTRWLKEGVRHPKNMYRFKIPMPFDDPASVEGALTVTVAEWEVFDPAIPFSVGCFMSNIRFEPHTIVVDIFPKTTNAKIVAVNIEGRIVQGKVGL